MLRRGMGEREVMVMVMGFRCASDGWEGVLV